MSGPVEAFGAVAGALTVAEAVLKTVKTLQNVFHAIKEADVHLSDQEARLDALSIALTQVKDSLERRKDKLPLTPERKHHDAITRILKNCLRDLELMQQNLPKPVEEPHDTRKKGSIFKRKKKPKFLSNASTALELYLKEDSRLSTRLQRNLLVLQWSIFTIPFPQSWDGREATLTEMRTIPPERDCESDRALCNIRPSGTLPECGKNGDASGMEEQDLKDLEDIEAWEKSWVALSTTVVSTRDIPQVNIGSTTKPRTSLHRSMGSFPLADTPRRSKSEVDIEFQENQKIVQHFQELNLQFYAAIHQRKGIKIKEGLEELYGEPFERRDRAKMGERLAQILLASKAPECRDEARGILTSLLCPEDGDQLDATQKNSIGYTLGKLYFDLGQYSDAIELLRPAFYGYKDMLPRHKATALEKVMGISDMVSDAYHALGEPGRARAWEQMTRYELGPDYIKPSEALREALHWCKNKGFDIQMDLSAGVAKPSILFDLVLDRKRNSPLHEAAGDPGINPDVLREILRHVNSLEGRNASGDTPLLIAVGASNKTAVEQLLGKFSNIHARSKGRLEGRETVLHKCKDTAIGDLLLENLKVSRRDSLANDPLYCGKNLDDSETMTIDTPNSYGMPPLHCACKAGRAHMVSFLLSHGANPDLLSQADGRPLDCALEARGVLKKNKKAIVRILVVGGADLSLKNKHGETYATAMKKRGFTSDDIKKMLAESSTEIAPSGLSRNNSFSTASSARKSSTATTFACPATPSSPSSHSPAKFLDLDLGKTDLRLDMKPSVSQLESFRSRVILDESGLDG